MTDAVVGVLVILGIVLIIFLIFLAGYNMGFDDGFDEYVAERDMKDRYIEMLETIIDHREGELCQTLEESL